jgi:hypothetical protein
MDEYVKLVLIVLLLFGSTVLLYNYDTLTMILLAFFMISVATFAILYLY